MLAIENKNYNYVENRSDVRDYKMPRRKTTRRSRRRPKEEGGDEGKETGGGDGGGGEGGGGIGGGGGVGGGGGGKGGREGGDERVASPDGGEGRVQGGELDADYLPVRKTHCTKNSVLKELLQQLLEIGAYACPPDKVIIFVHT